MGLEGSRREVLIIVALCLIWYAASWASNVVGKLVLTDFPFPMTVTMVQLLATVLLSAPVFSAAGVRRQTDFSRPYYWKVLVPLAFAKFFTTIFSQISIWKVPISYAHTVKATTPLWTAALGWWWCGERVGRARLVALAALAGGVALASLTELQFDGAGLAAALAAAALLAAQHIASKRVLRETGCHHLRLMQTLSGLALAMFLPAWACRDGWAPLRSAPALLWCDGALAWAQAVTAFCVLSRVSPLAYAVASTGKRVAVVGGSLLALRNPAPPANLAGMALAAGAVLAYSRAAAAERRAAAPARPTLPV